MCYCLPHLLCYEYSSVIWRSRNAPPPIPVPGPAGCGRYNGSSCPVLPSCQAFTPVCMGGSQMAARGPMMEPVLPTIVGRWCKAAVSPTIAATRDGRRAGQGRSLRWPPRDFPYCYSGSSTYNLTHHTVVKCQHAEGTALLGEPGPMWTDTGHTLDTVDSCMDHLNNQADQSRNCVWQRFVSLRPTKPSQTPSPASAGGILPRGV